MTALTIEKGLVTCPRCGGHEIECGYDVPYRGTVTVEREHKKARKKLKAEANEPGFKWASNFYVSCLNRHCDWVETDTDLREDGVGPYVSKMKGEVM